MNAIEHDLIADFEFDALSVPPPLPVLLLFPSSSPD
jgi:hypothetical protein